MREGSCPITAAVSNVSAGACELINMHRVKFMGEFLQEAHQDKWRIIGADCSEYSSSEKRKPIELLTIKQDVFIVISIAE